MQVQMRWRIPWKRPYSKQRYRTRTHQLCLNSQGGKEVKTEVEIKAKREEYRITLQNNKDLHEMTIAQLNMALAVFDWVLQ